MDNSLLDESLLDDASIGDRSPDTARGKPGVDVTSVSDESGADRPPGVSRLSLWTLTVSGCGLLVASGQPLAVAPLALLLAALVAISCAEPAGPGDRLGVVALLPLGFLVTCCWIMAWGITLDALGLGGWSSRWVAVAGVAGLAALTLTAVSRRGGRVHLARPDLPALWGLLGLAGFGVAVVIALPFEVWSRVVGSGTDFARHLFHIRTMIEAGGMPFGVVGYPRGLHAPSSLLITAVGHGLSEGALWRAVAPLAWLILCLMLAALMVAADRLTRLLTGRARLGAIAAVLGGLAFVQTAWFDTFLAFGNIMNMLVALAVLSLAAVGSRTSSIGSTLGTLTAASVLAVTANAWQILLPAVGVACLPWIAQWLRHGRRRGLDWIIWLPAAGIALNGLVDQRTRNVSSLVRAATVSDLFRPDWWWWLALALAVISTIAAFRWGLRSWSLSALGFMVVSAATVGWLLHATGSSWDLMLYYPVKALWTSMVIVVPLGAVGLLWAGADLSARAAGRGPTMALLTRSGLALLLGAAVIGVLGRGAAFPPHLQAIAQGRAGFPSWSLATVESLGDLDVAQGAKDGVIAFGIVPAGPVGIVTTGFSGMVDYVVMESLRFADLGLDDAFESPVKAALSRRDMTQVCRHLMDYPDSLRLTGPNLAAGPTWIIDSGCPEDVVKPAKWVSLDFDPAWLDRSPWESSDWSFPTFAEVQAASPLG